MALEVSGLRDFVAGLPDGLATQVGARGLKLSGGEKQRIAIARVILKNPSILLFDEATSSLDAMTERQVQKNLEQIATDRTTIVIAHRLSTIKEADKILVIRDGEIVEQGHFSTLIESSVLFKSLWDAQQRSEASLPLASE
jgi:ATP-binding cassette subfamily B protein